MDKIELIYDRLIKQVDTYNEYIDKVELFFDIQAWEKASLIHSKDSYNEYIKKFPDGRYFKEAKLLVKEFEDWEQCLQIKNVTSYKDYLEA